MKSNKLSKVLNQDIILKLYRKHKEKIKTAALPLLIGLAVLFFWFYGSGDDVVTNNEIPAESSAETKEETDDTTGAVEIYVDIDGEINKPGVYAVSEGTRLFQVIELAGGLTENASTSAINRAETVYDGQKITIVSSDLYEDGNTGKSGDNLTTENSGTIAGRVNINTADSVTLQTIPGIGPSKAERIIEYRNTQGRFKKTEDIKNVTGIGDKTYENIKDYITV